ncbi:MAG: redoxin domain-containing protein [Candidatus Poribacteria bacterium]|nr:redoxin domain-containing protein [Candidatus Poribacteria bacterium]
MMLFIETFYANPLLKFLVDTTMKSIVIFAVAGLLAFYFRHKSAAVRGFVWVMAIVGFLIVPLFSFILPKWEVNVLPETPIIRYETPQLAEISRSAAAPVLIAPSQLTTRKVSSTQVSPTPPQPKVVAKRNSILPTISWTNWIGIVWACVSIFFLARLIVGICAVWHVSVRANDISSTIDQVRLNWSRQFSVRLSDRIKVPMMWGIFRPVILLPTDAANWQTDRLRAVLLHETAHIKRWDWLTQTITQITCAAYWFNPFVWFTAHRIRTEAEQACDDQVLNAGCQSTDYARHLLNIARDVKLANTISRTAVAMARSSKIEGRLRTVLTENLNRHPVTKVAVGIGLLVLTCLVIPMSAVHLAQAVDPEETSKFQLAKDDPMKAQRNIEICEHHLHEIGKAIRAYQQEHGDFPEWLSDLYPKYLPDADALLCPADEDGGKPYYLVNTDPKMSVSYDYQFHPQYRKDKTEERLMYGDVLPLVRCRHHENQPFECHNLSFAFKVYWSSGVYKPDEMYETVEETIEVLEKGLQRQSDNKQFFRLYPTLARLYIEVGREKDVEGIVNRFKSVMNPDSIEDNFRLGSILEISNQPKETLKVFEKLEKRYPDSDLVLDELVRIHERLGNSELAEEYRDKADPMSELVGKVVPDFSETDLDGKPISLEQYRGKVVLLDFWAVWCGPCISEMPNVKRVYNTYKNQGFDIIGVSLDTDEVRLRNYLKANDISWRQIFSGQKWNSPLAKYYHIRSIPAPWLIARDGTLISREARGVKLEQLVVEALKNTSTNQ